MFKLTMSIAAATALLCGTAAIAQMPAAKATVATKTTKTMTAPKMAATTKTTAMTKPAAAATTKTTVMTTKPKTMATTGRMVTTKTSTGKTITYNCSLAGNKTKTACK